MTEARGVLVSHPGRQHSHHAASALAQAGLLAGYWAGVPSRDTQARWLPRSVRHRFIRYAPVDLPDALARWLPVAVLLRRVGRMTPAGGVERTIDYVACRAFDRQVARRLARPEARAVMACEISALDSFRAAKALGMKTILDAASVHYAVQDRVCAYEEPEWLHRRIVAVKQAEIELADHVITVSEMARTGYLQAGVPADRVHAVALGADTRLFRPLAARNSTGFTFLFVGSTILRKGVDLLLEAFGDVERRFPGAASLLIVGPRGDASALLDRQRNGAVLARPPVAQAQLLEVFGGADCLVLPSRHDSFGMAVVEAMACGVPVIVSEMVGAREAIEQGRSGWIVPLADPRALAERMAWCVQNPAAVAAMRPHARVAAERYSLDRYRAQLARVVASIVGDGR